MFDDILKHFYWLFFKKSNFSQSYEEEVLLSIFSKTNKGFYIDVGCHHPKRYSNTALLYKKGWNGINIDANSKNIKLFKLFRKRDHNIRALVSESKAIFNYHLFKRVDRNCFFLKN